MKLLILLAIVSCFGGKPESSNNLFDAVERGDRSFINSISKDDFFNKKDSKGDTPITISLKQYLGKGETKHRGVESILIPILVEMANQGILQDIGGVLIDGAEDIFGLDEDGLISTFLRISLDVGLLVFTMLNSPRRDGNQIILDDSDIEIIKNIEETNITIINNNIEIKNTFIEKAKEEVKTKIKEVDKFKENLNVDSIKENKDDFIKTITDNVSQYLPISYENSEILAKALGIGMKILKEIKIA